MNTNKKNKQTKQQRINRKGPKPVTDLRYLNMINSIIVLKNGQQKPISRGKSIMKFIDVGQSFNIPAVGGVINAFCPIAQGLTVNQRTGDTVFWNQLLINYTVSTENADVFNTSRIIIFQWHPNSILAIPAVTDILQSTIVYSMYDWQFSNQYTILYDRVHVHAGIAGSPCDSGNQGYFGSIPFVRGVKVKAEYAAASTSGSEQFFMLCISDSVIAPFPVLNVQSRVIYNDD